MDPSTLIPTPDQIPISWGWLQLLQTLTLYLHILAMNIMLGSVIITFFHHFSTEGGSSPITRLIAKKIPYTIAFAVNLGIAPLLFAQVLYGQFIYVSSVLMGVFWLSIVGLLIAAYYSSYIYTYQYETMRAGRMLVSGTSMISLLAIGFFLSNNMTLMLHPASWSRYFAHPDGFLLNLEDPTLLPRYLHFIASAVAVAGLAIALWYTYQQAYKKKESSQWIRFGCNWFSGATIVNYALGFWFLGVLPAGIIDPSTLRGGLFSLFLIVGVATGALAVIFAMRYRPIPATYLTLGTVLLMVVQRDLLRAAYLSPWFSPSTLPVHPAWSPFIFFLFFLIAGLLLIGWMLKTTYKALQGKEIQS